MQILLLSVATPAYLLLLAANKTQGTSEFSDIIFPAALVSALFLGYWADLQQWSKFYVQKIESHHLSNYTLLDFYTAKQVYRESPEHKVLPGYHQEDLDRGFNCTGLWSLSRHPNFLAEQSFWVLFYAYGASITRNYSNWTIVGAASYLFLFQASTWLTELISASKYPEYKEYQNRVGKFLPNFIAGLPGDFSDKRVAKR